MRPIRPKREKPWPHAARRCRAGIAQQPAFRDNHELHNAVLSPVGHIQKPSIGGNRDLRRRIMPGMPPGQRRDHLPLGRPPIGPVKHGHGRIEFVVHVQHRQGRVEDRMPRRRPGGRANRGLVGGRQTPVFEPKKESPVEALVRNHVRASGRVKNHRVRVGGSLLLWIGAGRALQLDRLADRLQRAVLRHRHHRYRTVAVVGDDQKAFGRVQRRINRVGALAIDLIQQRQRTRCLIDGKCAHDLAAAMHTVKSCLRSVQGEQRWVFQSADSLQAGPPAADGIDAVNVDAVATAVPVWRGITTDIGEHLTLPRPDP